MKAMQAEHQGESLRAPDLVCEVREGFPQALMLELGWEGQKGYLVGGKP